MFIDDKRSRRARGFTLLELAISSSILTLVLWASFSGWISSFRGSASGTARLESMSNSARAMVKMNLELQEASVRDETVEIYLLDPQTGELVAPPVDSTAVPPPDTIYPTADDVAGNSFALRFMTVRGFTLQADSVELEEDGPFVYRLGYGTPADFPRDYLVREEQGSPERPLILCKGVQQLVFQRDARGGAILITLLSESRDATTGQALVTRQVLTVTPKNDFSANLANIDMNGEEI